MLGDNPVIRRIIRFTGFEKSPVYLNAYALVLNTVSSAGLGFLYWLLAARLYGVEVVGTSAAAISTLLLISGLSQFSLDAGMQRFVPRAGRHARRLIIWGYILTAISAGVVGTVALWLIGIWRPSGRTLTGTVPATFVVLAMVFWAVFTFQDGVLIGLRRAVWVFIENLLYNLTKIGLLVVGVWLLHDAGILGSWFLPTPFLILFVGWMVFTRFAREAQEAPATAGDVPLTLKEVAKSVTGDHVGSLVSEASMRLLPVLVLSVEGAAASAYFYQSWMIAMTLTSVANGMTNAFTAEAAANREYIGPQSRAILRHMARVLVPLVVLVGVAAPLLLSLFGHEYAVNATNLLRLLALATIPSIFNSWYLNYSRVIGRIRRVVVLQIVRSGLLLGIGYVLLPSMGIEAIGVAWLLGNFAIALVGIVESRALLWSPEHEARHAGPVSLNRLLRRVDWRFLLPHPQPGRTAVFVEGFLGDAVREVAREPVDGLTADSASCELAVVRDPSREDLAAAFACLSPGGACYSEWREWRSGGLRHARGQLSEAGFTGLRAYWPIPRVNACRAWLELQPAPSRRGLAVKAVLTRHDAGAAANALLPAAANIALWLGITPSVAVVAHKPLEPDAAAASTPVPDFPDTLAEKIAVREGLSADDLTLVMRAGGDVIDSKVNWPVFVGSDVQPRWIAKVPRTSTTGTYLSNEHRMLEALASRADLPLAVPRVALWEEFEGLPVLVQTVLAGEHPIARARSIGFDAFAEEITDALIGFAGTAQPSARTEWWERLVGERLTRLERHLEALGEREIPAAVRAALAESGDVPLVWTHNDCTPWNGVLADGRLALFDWEDGDERGLPLGDLIYFIASVAFVLDGTEGTPDSAQSYLQLLDPATRRGATFGRCQNRYAAALGLTPEQLPALRIAAWLRHAVWDVENLVIEHGERASAVFSASVALPILRAELVALGSLVPGAPKTAAEKPGPPSSAVFVSPHLDDAALSCGGGLSRLVAAGVPVTIATICTADVPPDTPVSSYAQRNLDSWALGDAPFARRAAEDLEAARELGARAVHLGLTDAMYRVDERERTLYRTPVDAPIHPHDLEVLVPLVCGRLAPLLDADPTARVFCPLGVGGHVDHLIAREAVERLCPRERIVYYEDFPYLGWSGTAPKTATDGGSEPDCSFVLDLTPAELERRVEAVACYRSQLRGLFPSPYERLAEILNARLPLLGRRLLGDPDVASSRTRMVALLSREMARSGGERYRWYDGNQGSPFPVARDDVGIGVRVLETREEFDAIAAPWDELASMSGTVFLTRRWLSTWLEAYGEGCVPHILTAWNDSTLVAALPLVRRVHPRATRRIEFMGSGRLTPNHLDVIARAEFRDEALRMFARELLGERGTWDVLDFDKLPEDSDTAAAMTTAFSSERCHVAVSVSAVCPYVELPGSWEEFLAAMTPSARRGLRFKLNRLERECSGVAFHTASTEAEVTSALAALERLHQARWRGKGHAGSFADARFGAFHRAMAAGALADGTLRLSWLEIEGTISAVIYGFRTGGSVQFYLPAFDEEQGRHSPGLLLLARALEDAIAEGATRYDLLEGAEPYKSAWPGSGVRRNLRLLVFNRTAAGSVSRIAAGTSATSIALARRLLPEKTRLAVRKRLERARVR